MEAIRNLVLQIINILEAQEKEGNAVVIPWQYHSEHSLQTLGQKLSRLNQSVTDYLFVGIITKTPTEALRHAKQVLAEFLT